MYREFYNFDELLECTAEDKKAIGVNAFLVQRYPIRFVLFDNFKDSFQFVKQLQTEFGVRVMSVDTWLDKDDDDQMITHSKLADRIKSYIESDIQDSVITPFSELARFYNNTDEHAEFRALIKTIRGIQAIKKAEGKQRVYIPIVGLEGKMSNFQNDNQTFVWYYKSPDKELNYRLILTQETYGVRSLEVKYTVVPDMKSWLQIWKDSKTLPQIISTSKVVYAHSNCAKPDNAFTFCTCKNVYEFLTIGLKLDIEKIEYFETERKYWEQLAKEIDINNFSFENFVTKYYDIYGLEDYSNFLSAWFKHTDAFSRWLLTTYYAHKFCGEGYICKIIKECGTFTDQDFFTTAALCIFSLEDSENYIEERAVCLKEAYRIHLTLSDIVQTKLGEKLNKVALEKGYVTAIRYFSPLTIIEKEFAIRWFAEQNISLDNIKPFYPELYFYLTKLITTNEDQQWISLYFEAYKYAKITNHYTIEIESLINKCNSSTITFNTWYQDFKTVRTALDKRNDIEIYYWIDGLGIEWIPFINWLLKTKKDTGVYLNEVLIAKSVLPSTTEVNKKELQLLSLNALSKKGDLDSFAHTYNKYPNSIIEEINLVKEAIEAIISEHAGRKIAIISDHGLTALSQFCRGHNLAGVESDHHGRVAIRTSGISVSSNNYFILEERKMLCALRHESLCGKVPIGQSTHGGCTPEEILVPIFIISSEQNTPNWTAILMDNEVTAINPIIKYMIKGLVSSDMPYLLYNGKRYTIMKENDDIFISDRLELVAEVTEVILCIGQEKQIYQLKLTLGVQEDNLFSF